MKAIKVVVVGGAKTGKTTFIKRLTGEDLPKKYLPTLGVEVYHVPLHNKYYNFWDCAGNEKYAGLKEGYYVQGEIFLVFISDLNTTQDYILSIQKMEPNAKIILVKNTTRVCSDITIPGYHHFNICTKSFSGIIELCREIVLK